MCTFAFLDYANVSLTLFRKLEKKKLFLFLIYIFRMSLIIERLIFMLDLIIISFIAMLANAVGILSGFGTATIMTPTLLLFFPYTQCLLLSGVIVWVHNVLKASFYIKHINWRLLIYFGIPGVITTFLGASLVGILTKSELASLLPKALGALLIGYVIFLFLVPTFKLEHDRKLSTLGGAAQGFFAGLFGIKGPVRTMFLAAYDLPKAEYLGTIGAISFFVDSTRLLTYFAQGMRLEDHLLYGLLFFIPASYIGAKCAQYGVNKIPQKYFRPVVLLFLLVVGFYLLFMKNHGMHVS